MDKTAVFPGFDLPAAARHLGRALGVPPATSFRSVATGSSIAPDLAIWHDLAPDRVSLTPVEGGLLGIEMDGRGSYISLAVDLSGPMIAELSRDDILGCLAAFDLRHPARVFLRANIVQGPETVSIQRQLKPPADGRAQRAEFDLAYVDLLRRPLDRIWIDLIVESPGRNHLRIDGLQPYWRPRAQV
jgi:hypothetical protein